MRHGYMMDTLIKGAKAAGGRYENIRVKGNKKIARSKISQTGLKNYYSSEVCPLPKNTYYGKVVDHTKYHQHPEKHSICRFNTTLQTGAAISQLAASLQSGLIQKVVICAGAGISTDSGIPDFRTPGTGLYDNLKQYKIPYAEAIFDIDFFHYNPRPFFSLARELYPTGLYHPTYAHYFVRLLQERGILLRMYTQNIDGLERLAGVKPQKLVEAHGTFATATCLDCNARYKGADIKDDIFSSRLPRCSIGKCRGIVKPDIVFFGEDLPRKFTRYSRDLMQTDLVMVMGTSLEVRPFSGIVEDVRRSVPRILFNREVVGSFRHPRPNDMSVLGDLIPSLKQFVADIGWTEDINKIISNPDNAPTRLPIIAVSTSKNEQSKKVLNNISTSVHTRTRRVHNTASLKRNDSSLNGDNALISRNFTNNSVGNGRNWTDLFNDTCLNDVDSAFQKLTISKTTIKHD